MGLFKAKKKGAAGGSGGEALESQRKTRFPFRKPAKPSQQQSTQPADAGNKPTVSVSPAPDQFHATLTALKAHVPPTQTPQSREGDDDSLGDVPRSISTPSRDGATEGLPPLPATPTNDHEARSGDEDDDSLGSPCGAMLQHQRQLKLQRRAGVESTMDAAELHSLLQTRPPSMACLPHYLAALSPEVSPHPSGDVPSRALRALFALTENAARKHERMAMVAGSNENGVPSAVPALLAFLQRCPRDSSEQYLTLLVLNNLSIPRENKRRIAVEYGGAQTLGRLLCADPGCHLLVIVVVNLTFGEGELAGELVTGGGGGGSEGDEAGDADEIQLVESLGYALLLASLTAEQLATLGPVPLTSPEGTPHPPRELLASLFALLEEKLGIDYRRPASDATLFVAKGGASPFPETARWCLGALKNLTRPSKLLASGATARAVLDAGLLPVVLAHLEDDGKMNDWEPNSAPDAALYALVHVAGVPAMRGALRDEHPRCVAVLERIVDRCRATTGDGGPEEEEARLQCLKARMALSCLLLGGETNVAEGPLARYQQSAILDEREVPALLELLSNCLHGRAKEGKGGYSAASFSLKGVLRVVRCLVSLPDNGTVLASTANGGAGLSALLLKGLAGYSLLDECDGVLDAEAAEHIVVSLCQMSLHGMDEAVLGFLCPLGSGIFLPASFGNHGEFEARDVLARVLRRYINKSGTTGRGERAANQLLLRLHYLRFEGSVADTVASSGKSFPTKADLDLDKKLLAALRKVPLDEPPKRGAVPKEYVFDRAVAGREKDGAAATMFASPSTRVFPSALVAAEALAAEQPAGPVDIVATANNVGYYADGLDVYHGFVWRWADGQGDFIERIYSAAETEDQMPVPEGGAGRSEPRKGLLERLRIPIRGNDDEPFSILGLKCGAAACGRGSLF